MRGVRVKKTCKVIKTNRLMTRPCPLFIFHKNRILSEEQLGFSAAEIALQLDDGVFTTVRVSAGHPENLAAHAARLKRDCAAMEIEPPAIQMAQINALIDANRAGTDVWRLKIFAAKTGGSNLTMTLAPYIPSRHAHYPITIFPAPVIVPTAKVKTIAYAHRFLIKQYAEEQGYMDALTLDGNGNILEGSFSNFFWSFEKCLYVPALDLPLLQGTFLTALMAWAKKTNYPVSEVRFSPKEIPDGSSLFLCNALTHLQAVDAIEKRSFLRNPELESRLLKGAFGMFQNLF